MEHRENSSRAAYGAAEASFDYIWSCPLGAATDATFGESRGTQAVGVAAARDRISVLNQRLSDVLVHRPTLATEYTGSDE